MKIIRCFRGVQKNNTFKVFFCWSAPLNSILYLRLRAEVLDEFLSLTEYDLSTYDMSMSIFIYEYEVIIKLNYSKMSLLCYTC